MAPWEEYQAAAAASPTTTLKPWEEYAAAEPRDYASEIPSGAELTHIGVEGERNLPVFVRHALDRASHVVPTSWGELGGLAESFVPPIEAFRQAKSGYDIATGTPPEQAIPGISELKDLEDIKAQYGGDSPEYQAAAGNVAGDILPQMIMAGLVGKSLNVPKPDYVRSQPLVPEPPPTQSLGPGTIADDVRRALERRFTMQEPPPEAPPDIAPSVPIEQTLPNIPQQPPVFNPELGPTMRPDFQMPLQTETAVTPGAQARMAALLKEKAKLDDKARISGAIGQKLHESDTTRLSQVNQELGQPEAPPPAAPQVTIPTEDAAYAGEQPQPVQAPPVQTGLPESGFSTERAQAIYGEDAVLITKGKSAKAWKAKGQADTRDPYAVMTEARARGIATPEDSALFRAEHQRLLEHARQVYGTPEYNARAQNAVDFLNASKQVAHGPASDIMRGLQEADPPRYDSPADFDNIIRERINREATLEQKATFQKVADEVRNGDRQARESAANGQEALKKYRPRDVVPFDEAADYVKQQIKDLTEPCAL